MDDDDVEHICRIAHEGSVKRPWRVICQCAWTETFSGLEAALHIILRVHGGIVLEVPGPLLTINELP